MKRVQWIQSPSRRRLVFVVTLLFGELTGCTDSTVRPHSLGTHSPALGNNAQALELEPDALLRELDEKSADYRSHRPAHLVRNYVVALRNAGGTPEPDELGDATTYSAYALMADVERYLATADSDALEAVERYADAILGAQDSTGLPGIIGRFVEADGTPYLKSASLSSKDVITTSVGALSRAYPFFSGARKLRVENSVRAIGDEFLAERPTKPKYAFGGTYTGPGTRNPNEPDSDKVFVSFGPALTIGHVAHIAERSPEQLRALADTLDMLRNSADSIDDTRVVVNLVIQILTKQCDSFQNVSDEELRQIDDFVTNLADFSLSLRGRGRFGGPAVQAQLRNFVDALIVESRGAGNIERVIAEHWTTGVPELINLGVTAISQFPDVLPAFFKLLRDVLGSDEAVYDWLENVMAGHDDGRLKREGQDYVQRWAWRFAQCVLFRRNLDGLERFGRRFDQKFIRPIGRGRVDVLVRNIGTNLRQNLGGAVRAVNNTVKSVTSSIKKLGRKLGFADLTPEQVQALREEKAKAVVAALREFRSDEARSIAALREFLGMLPSGIAQPEEFRVDPGDGTLQGLQVLKVAHQITGDARFGSEYASVAGDWLRLNRRFGTALDRLVTQAFGDRYRDALEIAGTHALKWTAIATLLRTEDDPALRSLLLDIVNEKYGYESDEWNAWVDLIVASSGGSGAAAQWARAVESLRLFPRYEVADPDYCTAPHARIPGFCAESSAAILDEFGGYVSFLAQPGTQGSRLAIPLDRRPRDALTWQRSPRRLTNGNDLTFAGLDYELAYWTARGQGVLTPCGSPLCSPLRCEATDSEHVRPTLLGARSVGSGEARGIGVECASGQLALASQDGSSGVLQGVAFELAEPRWIARQAGLDYRGLAIAQAGTAPLLVVAGVAAPGRCGSSDGVGDAEGKSVISVFDAAGTHRACSSQKVFPYSGHEQHLAVSASPSGIFTAGFFENCGFGHYVNVLSHYDGGGGLVGRVTEPGVSFTGRNCIGPSMGRSVAASAAGPVFVGGVSGLSGEGASRAFVSRFDPLVRSWKARSAYASDFFAVAEDASGVFAAGTCSGQPCVEKYDRSTGTAGWSRRLAFAGGLTAVVAPGNGRIYATGTISAASGTDVVVLTLDAQTGQELPVETYSTAGTDTGRAIATSGRELYIAGDTVRNGAPELFILRYALVAQ
jgi:hypothetical protein